MTHLWYICKHRHVMLNINLSNKNDVGLSFEFLKKVKHGAIVKSTVQSLDNVCCSCCRVVLFCSLFFCKVSLSYKCTKTNMCMYLDRERHIHIYITLNIWRSWCVAIKNKIIKDYMDCKQRNQLNWFHNSLLLALKCVILNRLTNSWSSDWYEMHHFKHD